MKIHFLFAWVALGTTAMAASANEGDGAENVPPVTMQQAIEQIEATQDPIMERYVDLGKLGAAWTFLDAEALADIGIGLAEAERILFRNHPLIKSEDLLRLAVRTAGVKRQADVLENLKRHAQELNDEPLLEQISMAAQLAGGSRSIAPQLSLDDVSLGAFIAYKQARHDLDAAMVFGSLEMLQELRQQVAKWSESEPAIWKDLNQHVEEQVKVLESLGAPSRGGSEDMSAATASLNQLTAASRRYPYGQPPYGQPAYGRPPFGPPPSGQPSFGQLPYGGGFQQGGAIQQQTQLDYWNRQQVQVQRPGAMVGGAAMMGIAQGLNQQNPQKNAVAVGILGALGQAMILNSQPSVEQQGGMRIQQQGQFQQWGGGFN